MIKVILLLKKADGLSRGAFYDWWINKHAPHVCEDQAPHLKRYQICTRDGDWADLPTGIAVDDAEWDGVAACTFADEAGYRAVYDRKLATTSETVKYVKEIKRIVAHEYEIDIATGHAVRV